MSGVRAESERKLSGVRAKSLTCVSAGASSRVSAPSSHNYSLGTNHADNSLGSNHADTQPSSPQFHISENAGGRERVTRPIIIGVCSHCAGQGQVPVDGEDLMQGFQECDRCYGHGDLDAARLIEAYECGRRDALSAAEGKLDALSDLLQVVREQLAAPESAPTYRQLRERVG